MRIHTRIVFDLATGRTLADEWHEHAGDIAECGGGGKGGGGDSESTTITVDKEYNARMARIAEEQQSWAREYFNLWREHYKPYEIAQAQANMELLPYETELYKGQLSSAQGLLPAQTEAAQKFLSASSKGVDVNERMAQAQADASNAWKDVRAETNRAMARMGVNPNSGRYQGINAAADVQKSAQVAGARTNARIGAEQENYERLKNASQVNPVGTILSGVSALKG